MWQRYSKQFKNYLQLERSFSPHSIDAYLRDVKKLWQHIDLQGLNLNPLQVKQEHLESLLKYLNDLHLADSSQARILSGIRAFYEFLDAENLLENNPVELMSMPQIPHHLPDTLHYEEINDLLEAIDLKKSDGKRNRAMIEILYSSGLRVSELINLKMPDILEEIKVLRIIGKNSKERLVPIGNAALNCLKTYLQEVRTHQKIKDGQEHFVFISRLGTKLSRQMIFMTIQDLARKIDLKKPVSPHTFRHSFATHLIEGGADLRAVQEMLGHESINTTQIYINMDLDFLRQTITEFHPRARKNFTKF
ncbi:MAG: tyrosine recombinase [Bacteroidetes bacterium]|nr:MAG: tyrosine recombinase [Bacteroidota bacterium]